MTDDHPDHWKLLILDYFPRSLNRTQDRHWSHRHKRKQQLIDLLTCTCIQQGGVPSFSGHVKMSITRLMGKRQREFDDENIASGVKLIRDVMRKRKKAGKGWAGGLGIIEDDSRKHCELTVDQRRNDIEGYEGRECTLIVVEGKRVK